MVLLVGAALLIRTSIALGSVERGFSADNVLAAAHEPLRFPLREHGERRAGHSGRARADARRCPESSRWALRTSCRRDSTRTCRSTSSAASYRREQFTGDGDYAVANPGYFATFRIPLLRGRDFSDADTGRRAWGRHREPSVRGPLLAGRRRARRAHLDRRRAHEHPRARARARDRRHRRRRSQPQPRCRARADDVRAASAVVGPVQRVLPGRHPARVGRAHGGPAGAACERDSRTRCARSTGVPVIDTETMEDVVSISTLARTLQHAADEHLRRCRARARGARHLRAHGVLRAATDAGARHPRRARRRSRGRSEASCCARARCSSVAESWSGSLRRSILSSWLTSFLFGVGAARRLRVRDRAGGLGADRARDRRRRGAARGARRSARRASPRVAARSSPMSQIRHALRQLAIRPGVSLAMILMLALGLGATTAIFTLFQQILLQPLPVREPEALVNLAAPGPKTGTTSCSFAGECDEIFSYPMFRDLEAQQTVFSSIAAHRDFDASLSDGGRAEIGRGIMVSGSYFSLLDLPPTIGRLIGARRRAADRRVGGRRLEPRLLAQPLRRRPRRRRSTAHVNGQSLTIVGVAPEGFSGTIPGFRPQVFVPLTLRWLMEPTRPRDEADRRAYWVYLFARLKPDVAIEQAAAGINALYGSILNEIEAPLNTSMADELLAQFRQRQITLAPGGARAELGSGGRRAAADAAARNHRRGVADRLRQHREPTARARRVAGRRDGDSRLDRRQPLAAGLVAADGDQRAGRRRQPFERARRGAHGVRFHGDLTGVACRRLRARAQLDRFLVRSGCVVVDRRAVQRGARRSSHSCEPRSCGQGARVADARRARHGALPHRIGDDADRVLDGLARPRGTIHAKPGERRTRGPRDERGLRRHVHGLAADEWARRRGVDGDLRPNRGAAGRGARRDERRIGAHRAS